MTQDNGKIAHTETELTDPVERLFQTLRRSELPLNEQLARISATIEEYDAGYAQAYHRLVARLNRNGVGESAPKTGERMPEFLLPDESGRLVSLKRLLEDGPVVVTFLRGHWCPYCRLNAIGLASIEKIILPARIVVITAETAQFSRALREESGANFHFLTDVGSGYALSLGLQFWLGEDLAAMLYDDACDIPGYQGADGWFLPIPGVFVVGADGKIREQYVNPDFRQRMELDALVEAAIRASVDDI